MAPREFSIQLKTDHDSVETDELMKGVLRMAAKHLLAQAMLLPHRRPPQIIAESGDHFEAAKEISLADDMPEDDTAETQKGEGALTPDAERARVAGYTVSDRGTGWKFNDPDGAWSEQSFTTEGYAWEGAYADSLGKSA